MVHAHTGTYKDHRLIPQHQQLELTSNYKPCSLHFVVFLNLSILLGDSRSSQMSLLVPAKGPKPSTSRLEVVHKKQRFDQIAEIFRPFPSLNMYSKWQQFATKMWGLRGTPIAHLAYHVSWLSPYPAAQLQSGPFAAHHPVSLLPFLSLSRCHYLIKQKCKEKIFKNTVRRCEEDEIRTKVERGDPQRLKHFLYLPDAKSIMCNGHCHSCWHLAPADAWQSKHTSSF